LLSLVIGILSSNFFKLFKIVVLTLPFLGLIVRLKFGVLLEKLGNFFTISLDDLTSFPDEGSLNVFNLVVVVLTHIIKLLSHCLNKLIDVIILLLDSFDVFLIFVFELVDESLNQNVFLFDNLLACFLLNLDISGKLFTVFLFFKLLPSPIDFNILLMRCNDLSLNFVGSLLSHLFFQDPSLVLEIISVCSDLRDDVISGSLDLV
jgi:hypothetical protein